LRFPSPDWHPVPREDSPTPRIRAAIYHIDQALDQLLVLLLQTRNDNHPFHPNLIRDVVLGHIPILTDADPGWSTASITTGRRTVLNRFLMQARSASRHRFHGTGGQTRAFIHIAIQSSVWSWPSPNPPKSGEKVRIYNQMTESHKVKDSGREGAARSPAPR